MASTKFTTRPFGHYHKAPEMKHAILENGIAIAWTDKRQKAEFITASLNVAEQVCPDDD